MALGEVKRTQIAGRELKQSNQYFPQQKDCKHGKDTNLHQNNLPTQNHTLNESNNKQ